MGRARIFLAIAASLAMSSCSMTVQPPGSAIGTVRTGSPAFERTEDAVAELSNQNNVAADMQVESEVSDVSLKAWRKALAGNTKEALHDLDLLSQRYPNVGTINFMRGQILDHSGDKKAAIAFYQRAITDKEFSSITLFKLAEALRQTHRDKEAIPQYRRLLHNDPEFIEGQIGLAQSLLVLNTSSSEAHDLLKSAVIAAKEQNNEAGAANAQKILDEKFVR